MLQPKIIDMKPLPDYRLALEYEDGKKKIFDVKPYISGDWFGQLADPGYFKRVRLICNGTGIEWPNGQDIAPHELYENE